MPARFRLATLAAGLLIALAAAHPPAYGQASSAIMRAQQNAIQRTITTNTRLAVRPKLVISRGATGPVTAISASRDGRYLATALGDGTARLWDLTLGSELRSYRSGPIRSLLITPDNRGVLLATAGGQVHLYDIESDRRVREFAGHIGPVLALAVTPDGRRLATAGADGTVRIWELGNGRPLATQAGHVGAVHAVAFSPDGQSFASGGADESARIWRTGQPAPVAVLGGHRSTVTAVAFDPSGAVITGTEDRVIRLWDPASQQPRATIRGAGGPAFSIQATPRGPVAVSGDTDNVIRVWDVQSGQLVRELRGHEGPVRFVLFDLARQRVVSGSEDGTTKIWNVESGAAFAQLISTVGGWAVLDNAGRFDGSETAVNDIEWQASNTALPLDKFSQTYYEPGLLAKHLSAPATLITPAAPPVSDGILLPLRAAFVGAINPTPRADGRILVPVEAQNQGGGIAEVRLYHEGKRMPQEAIVDDRTERDGSRRVATFAVTPVPGLNRFEALGLGDRNIEGPRAAAQVNVAGAAPIPRLHVLVIGINDYGSPELRLDFGRPDALAILRTLSKAPRDLFGEVIGYQLLDGAATRSGILNALAQMQRIPGEDALVVFIAGHGLAVAGEWYFLPQEYSSPSLDPAEATRVGISSKQLSDALLRSSPRKIVLVMDSCQSGAAVMGIRSTVERKVLRELGRSDGIHVLAATRADQQAYELPKLKQGLLTYTVLEALQSRAPFARDAVTASELVRYAATSLPQIARREYPSISQNPVAYSGGEDFRLFRLTRAN